MGEENIDLYNAGKMEHALEEQGKTKEDAEKQLDEDLGQEKEVELKQWEQKMGATSCCQAGA